MILTEVKGKSLKLNWTWKDAFKSDLIQELFRLCIYKWFPSIMLLFRKGA